MQVILILGAAVWATGPSPALQRRCDHAFALWKTDRTQILVPCGGLGQHPPAEAAVMADMLRKHGVPAAQIRQEDLSTTTYENIRNALDLLDGAEISKLTIVSDRYHLPRAAMVAAFFGYRATVSSPSLKGAHWPTQIRNTLREAGAIPAYALKLIGHKMRQQDKNKTSD